MPFTIVGVIVLLEKLESGNSFILPYVLVNVFILPWVKCSHSLNLCLIFGVYFKVSFCIST